MKDLALSLILPVYNEAENLESVVSEALADLSNTFSSYEVIIVNDSSKDGTAEVADKLVQKYPEQVRVIHLQANKGYKEALTEGFKSARGLRLMTHNPSETLKPGLRPNV